MFQESLKKLKKEVSRVINVALVEESASGKTERLKKLFVEVEQEHEKEIDHICALLNKYFEPPCQYEYDDIDAYDLIDQADDKSGISWCEANCYSDGYKGGAKCWKRFLDLMRRLEIEQLEYGKEQDG